MAKKCNKTIEMADAFGWKMGHGGKREGAGRKKTAIETKTIRVPVALIPQVQQLITDYKARVNHDSNE